MIHWAFLILAFLAGFATCWWLFCEIQKAAGKFLEWIAFKK